MSDWLHALFARVRAQTTAAGQWIIGGVVGGGLGLLLIVRFPGHSRSRSRIPRILRLQMALP